MAVAKDVSMTGGNSADNTAQQVSTATSISAASPMTIGGSATLLIAMMVWAANSRTAPASPAMTWNSVSMTLALFVSNATGGNFAAACLFYLISPATGSHTLAGSWTNSNDCYMSAISFTGTDTTTGITTADNTQAANATTITIPSTTDGATVACFAVNGSTPTMNFNRIWSEAALNPGGGGSYQLAGTSNAHTFTGAGGTLQQAVGVHVIAAGGGGGGRTLSLPSGLDGLSTSGPKQFNPSLGYHRHPAISLEAYHRDRERAHRAFMAKVQRAA